MDGATTLLCIPQMKSMSKIRQLIAKNGWLTRESTKETYRFCLINIQNKSNHSDVADEP